MVVKLISDAREDGTSWRDWAACRGFSHMVFFPERGQTTRQAKQICQGCPVRMECFEYSIETKQNFGVWGGATEAERRVIRRRLRKEERLAEAAALEAETA